MRRRDTLLVSSTHHNRAHEQSRYVLVLYEFRSQYHGSTLNLVGSSC